VKYPLGQHKKKHREIDFRMEAGITLLDTGDFYGVGHNEFLIGEALGGRNRDQAMFF
jgi:aryl-alcohol dehydrogenase-like predicted oxidoreductase